MAKKEEVNENEGYVRTRVELHNVLFLASDKEVAMLKAIMSTEMHPNLTDCSRLTGIPVSTLFDVWTKMRHKYDICVVVRPKVG